MHESVPRSTTGSSVLVMVAERHGVPEDVALRGSGVSRELLDSPTGEVSREQEVAIVSNIVAQLDGSVGVGAEVGMHYHMKTFGVWGFALLSSPTLRSALQTGVQFLDLTFALSRIAVREIEDETRLYFDVSHLPPDIRGFVLERDGLGIRTIQLELLGEVMPLRRIVTQQPGTPEDQELLSQLLQADVTMNAPVTFASFDRDLLDQSVLNADPAGSLYAHPERLTPAAFLHDTLGLRRSRGFLAHIVRVPFYRFTKCTVVPTTILWGDRDRVLLPSQAKVAKRRLPNATHASLGYAGHCAQHDVPELVIEHAKATFALAQVSRAS